MEKLDSGLPIPVKLLCTATSYTDIAMCKRLGDSCSNEIEFNPGRLLKKVKVTFLSERRKGGFSLKK